MRDHNTLHKGISLEFCITMCVTRDVHCPIIPLTELNQKRQQTFMRPNVSDAEVNMP